MLSSADPMNLKGIILPGDKVAISAHTHVIFRDGVVVAVQNKNEMEYAQGLDNRVFNRLSRKNGASIEGTQSVKRKNASVFRH